MMSKILIFIIIAVTAFPSTLTAQSSVATTTLSLSICGNLIVDDGEQCDIPGETGVYSQTIAGRQCNAECNFGPYCGDGILQTVFNETCDDGNNDNGDFCSATCVIEPAGSGGGGSSGGGSGGGGGSSRQQGDTLVSIRGRAYPSTRINFLLDSEVVGSVQSNSSGAFEFSTEASPGTATLGIWANDSSGTRSITFNNTFDVTQGAITNVNGVVLPPTIRVASQNISPGTPIIVSGQSVPSASIELHVNNSSIIERTTAGPNGQWSVTLPAGRLGVAQHTVRARSITGTAPNTTQSSFSNTLQLFVGVDGQASTPSDLSRDGRVNLTDFSILIFWWQTSGGNSDPAADINGNGRVSLEDFSILLFNWTG